MILLFQSCTSKKNSIKQSSLTKQEKETKLITMSQIRSQHCASYDHYLSTNWHGGTQSPSRKTHGAMMVNCQQTELPRDTNEVLFHANAMNLVKSFQTQLLHF